MKASLFLAAFIAVIPSAAMRRFLWRRLLGYQIPASASIAGLTLIAVKSFRIGENVKIGPLNLFKGPIDVTIGAHSRIGRGNHFTASWHIVEPRFADRGYDPKLNLGERTLVLNNHFVDCYGRVDIGDGTWLAGHDSQLWTHGLSVRERDIAIGSGNYIGSAVRIAPGARIGNGNIVGMAAVVSTKTPVDNMLIAGFPAKPIRSVAEDFASGAYRFTFDDW